MEGKYTYELTCLKSRYRIASLPLSDSTSRFRQPLPAAHTGNSLKTLNCSTALALSAIEVIPVKF